MLDKNLPFARIGERERVDFELDDVIITVAPFAVRGTFGQNSIVIIYPTLPEHKLLIESLKEKLDLVLTRA